MAHKVKVLLLGLSCLGNFVKGTQTERSAAAHRSLVETEPSTSHFFCLILVAANPARWTGLVHLGSVEEKGDPFTFFLPLMVNVCLGGGGAKSCLKEPVRFSGGDGKEFGKPPMLDPLGSVSQGRE